MDYYKLEVKVKKELEESFEELLYDFVYEGWEKEYTDEDCLFKIYLSNLQRMKEVEGKILEKFPDVKITLEVLPERDWFEKWRKELKPVKIRRFIIVPSELGGKEKLIEEAERERLFPVIIDPGFAFGTGYHETTRLMLKHIFLFFEGKNPYEKFYKKFLVKKRDEFRVLDMGCGTGILAIATALICPEAKIKAVDIDERAIEATLKNARINKVSEKIEVSDKVSESERFHLIYANIGFFELKKLVSLFKKVLFSEGLLFLSGILKGDIEKMSKLYENEGFLPLCQDLLGEWAFLSFLKSEFKARYNFL